MTKKLKLLLFPLKFIQEITVDDVRLALKLSDSRITGIDANVNAVEELKEEINKHSLESLLDKAPISIRSLPLLGTQRPFTMIPGSEAYSNVSWLRNTNHIKYSDVLFFFSLFVVRRNW